ncbi:MAG: nucleotidyltransferase domain-containing protein [Bacteroidales bacterium]|nr:nucleotidyltransferase domain-containing protein [Bacteroidales bacterium]
MNNDFGIYKNSYNLIVELFQKYSSIEKVSIFGSRAIGNYKKGSDIDLAIFGKDISYDIVTKISAILNEDLPIPYFIDVVHYESLKNEALKTHILEKGKIIYTKQLTITD